MISKVGIEFSNVWIHRMIQSYIGAVLRSFSQEALEARDVSIRMLQWIENYKF
jgi:hypothetical protein